MTIRFTDGDEVSEDVLGLSEALFKRAFGDVQAALERFEQGDLTAVKDGRQASQSLLEFGGYVIKGRMNVDKLRKQAAGVLGAGNDLDLDAARDEIGRRLACLRNARGD